jgi:hypothetical protein
LVATSFSSKTGVARSSPTVTKLWNVFVRFSCALHTDVKNDADYKRVCAKENGHFSKQDFM